MSTHAHTEYTYDVSPGQSNPSSKANRLLRYDVYDAPNGTPIRDVTYAYDVDGHVSQIVRHGSSSSNYYATLLYYKNRSQLWLAVDETWTMGETNTCQRTKVREFRTDSPRQRYMVQSRDPNSTDPPLQPLGDAVWTDYAGNTALRDYTIQIEEPEPPNEQLGLSETDLRYQSPGDWQADATEAPIFYHSDHLGTTRLMTNELGQIVQYAAFTAFGEPVASLSEPDPALTRYGYAGAWGYEGLPHEQAVTDNFPYLHVGARYYDPEIGRFLQRDPIGIRGGLNAYVYVDSDPLNFADPPGTDRYYLRPGGHSEVWFDDPNGGYIGYDFGPAAGKFKLKGLFPCKGNINRVKYYPGSLPCDAVRHSSTPAQDAEDMARIEHQQKDPPTFSISGLFGSNCLGWASFWASLHDPAPTGTEYPHAEP